MSAAFEADLEPRTGAPRIRFNLANGWTASIVLRLGNGPFNAWGASLAACPTGRFGEDRTELGESEASADETVRWLAEIAARAPAGATS